MNKKTVRLAVLKQLELPKHYLGTVFFASDILVWSVPIYSRERGDKRTLLCNF